MENLHLIDEDGYLIRAAMLAFYKDPERWVTGSYIKIGYFGKSDADLKYQDEVHGSLIEQIDKTIDLVYTKYLKALIYYDGIQRIEQFMFPQEAFREILLNAVVHKDYSACNPIQISVYEDKIYIWNDGEMPSELDSTEKLFEKHSSKPYNPKLANVFFKSGMIEAWGRGLTKSRRLVQGTMDVCRNTISVHLELWCCVMRVISIWICFSGYILTDIPRTPFLTILLSSRILCLTASKSFESASIARWCSSSDEKRSVSFKRFSCNSLAFMYTPNL